MSDRSAEATTDPGTPESGSSLRRVVLAGSIGNIVEWFDFAVYGYLAGIIGTQFFPSEDETASLLASFAVFGAAFFIRPFGSIIFGPIGDRYGRRGVLSVAILLMSAATFAVGILPAYATIGLWAPALLVFLRLFQGFSASGELSGAATFIAEYSPNERRGLFTSWIQFTATLGFLIGLSIPTLLTSILSEDSLNAWAWRVPFLVGGVIGVIGLYIRLKIEDTPVFQALERAGRVPKSPLRDTLVHNWRPILTLVALECVFHLGYYLILTYTPTYLKRVLDFPQLTAFVVTAVALLVDMAVIPFAGILADRVGRKPLLIAATAGFAVFTLPIYLLISQGGFAYPALGLGVLGGLHGLLLGATAPVMAELFPTNARNGGLSIGHNVANALFGGTAPFLATYLITTTGSDLVPAFIIVAGALVSLVAAIVIRESARQPLKPAYGSWNHP